MDVGGKGKPRPREIEVLRSVRWLLQHETPTTLEVCHCLPYLAQHNTIVSRANALGREEWSCSYDDQDSFFADTAPIEGEQWHSATRSFLLDICYQLQDKESFDLVALRFREWVTGREGLDRVVDALAPPTTFLLKLLSEKVMLVAIGAVKSALSFAGQSTGVVDKPGSWRVTIHFVTHEIFSVTANRTLVGPEEIELCWSCVFGCERKELFKASSSSGAVKLKGSNVLNVIAQQLETGKMCMEVLRFCFVLTPITMCADEASNKVDVQLYQVEVLHAHKASSETEMSLLVGEVLAVMLKHPSGWWRGRKDDGTTGWFPACRTRATAQTLEAIKARAKLKVLMKSISSNNHVCE
jgi:hypothetical protein